VQSAGLDLTRQKNELELKVSSLHWFVNSHEHLGSLEQLEMITTLEGLLGIQTATQKFKIEFSGFKNQIFVSWNFNVKPWPLGALLY
jgi:hypothetical protein